MLVLVEHMYSLNILILVQDILLSILYASPLYFWLRPFNKLADKNIGGALSSFKLGIHLSVGILIALAVQIICYGTITYLFL